MALSVGFNRRGTTKLAYPVRRDPCRPTLRGPTYAARRPTRPVQALKAILQVRRLSV